MEQFLNSFVRIADALDRAYPPPVYENHYEEHQLAKAERAVSAELRKQISILKAEKLEIQRRFENAIDEVPEEHQHVTHHQTGLSPSDLEIFPVRDGQREILTVPGRTQEEMERLLRTDPILYDMVVASRRAAQEES
jgi:hypothetical protein